MPGERGYEARHAALDQDLGWSVLQRATTKRTPPISIIALFSLFSTIFASAGSSLVNGSGERRRRRRRTRSSGGSGGDAR